MLSCVNGVCVLKLSLGNDSCKTKTHTDGHTLNEEILVVFRGFEPRIKALTFVLCVRKQPRYDKLHNCYATRGALRSAATRQYNPSHVNVNNVQEAVLRV